MQTENCAILHTDLLADVAYLLDDRRSATPAEFHALNSLVEAVIFHEKLYLYGLPTDYETSELYDHLVEEEIIHSDTSPDIFESELKSRGMEDVAGKSLVDRYHGPEIVGHDAGESGAALSALVDYEKHLGFARMSKLRDKNPDFVKIFAHPSGFSNEDIIVIDDTYRRARAFSACAAELGLEMYTGIMSRPFVLGVFSAKRRNSLVLYEKMLTELDDVEDVDVPSWRTIEIPALTQVLLENCNDSPDAIPNELTRLRHRMRKFRNTLTEQEEALASAKSRGEKRKIRCDTNQAWAALLEKQDRSTRITHHMWDMAKAVSAPIKAVDKLVEKDKKDQIILKVQGLTDLWRVLYDAPTIEQNVRLVKNLFKIDVNVSDWNSIARIAGELDTVMRRNDELSLPQQV